jgi:hypothetical protein
MRTILSALAMAALCATMFAAPALASDVEGVRAKFREMDANGDRALQFGEIRAERAKVFDRMDVNGNAIFDRDEIDTIRKVAQSRQAQSGRTGLLSAADLAGLAKQIDTDGDGKITREEFSTHLPERLSAADKDGNQTLSLRELRSLKRDRETTTTQ